MKMRLNNKGLSLVELLLTLAIFALVMIGVAMIMRTTSVSYKDGANEVTMQTEAQIVANQIEEIFMDGTEGYCTGTISGHQFYGITSNYASHFIIHKAAEQEIWYQSKAIGATSPGAETSGGWSLMAENVESVQFSGYSEDKDNANCDNIVTVKVKMNRDGYIYTATKDIYFRNSIENKYVTMLNSSSDASSGSGAAFKEVYVERYEVVDLCKEFAIDITKPIQITGLKSNTYKLVVPSYSTGNKDTYKAISGITDATGADTNAQIAFCKTKGAIALTPTDTLNSSLTSTVNKAANVTVVATSITGETVRVIFLTEQVKFSLQDKANGPEGLVLMTASNASMPRYTWITVKGINYTDMVHLHGKKFQFGMAMYTDTNNNNMYDSNDTVITDSGSRGPYYVADANLQFDYKSGPTTGAFIGNQTAVYMCPDPESGDLLICMPEAISQQYQKDAFSSGNTRIAFVIKTPSTNGDRFDVVDMVMLYQAEGSMDISKYDTGYTATVSNGYLDVTFVADAPAPTP